MKVIYARKPSLKEKFTWLPQAIRVIGLIAIVAFAVQLVARADETSEGGEVAPTLETPAVSETVTPPADTTLVTETVPQTGEVVLSEVDSIESGSPDIAFDEVTITDSVSTEESSTSEELPITSETESTTNELSLSPEAPPAGGASSPEPLVKNKLVTNKSAYFGGDAIMFSGVNFDKSANLTLRIEGGSSEGVIFSQFEQKLTTDENGAFFTTHTIKNAALYRVTVSDEAGNEVAQLKIQPLSHPREDGCDDDEDSLFRSVLPGVCFH